MHQHRLVMTWGRPRWRSAVKRHTRAPINTYKRRNLVKKTLCVLLTLALLGAVSLSLAENKVYQIGIAQFAVHGSLDNCREGFIQGLKENGFEEGKNIQIDYQNAQADMGLAAGIASKFVDNGYDLILAIATPMAVVSHNTSDGKVPVIYSAVSTPVQEGLAGEDAMNCPLKRS